MAIEQIEEVSVVVPEFGIEIDHPRNNQVLLQCITGEVLRSAIDGAKPIIPKEGKDATVPTDQLHGMGSMPKTPGMQVHVNPVELTYEIIDPLHGDEELCEKLRLWIDHNSSMTTGKKLNGAPPKKGTLDKHRMKSLCRELFWLVEAGEAKRCKGSIPSMEDIVDLPGHFLRDPGARSPTHQPKFEKDYEEWVENVSRSGV